LVRSTIVRINLPGPSINTNLEAHSTTYGCCEFAHAPNSEILPSANPTCRTCDPRRLAPAVSTLRRLERAEIDRSDSRGDSAANFCNPMRPSCGMRRRRPRRTTSDGFVLGPAQERQHG